MRPEGRVSRETQPRQRRRILYTRDGGGRASPPPPWARGRFGTLVLRVSASPPPRLFLLGATGCPRPPIQPRRRRRRRQRQQVNYVPKALARPTWSSPRELLRSAGRDKHEAGPAHARSAAAPERGSRKEDTGVCPAHTQCASRGAQCGDQGRSERCSGARPGFGAARLGGEGAASTEHGRADRPTAKNHVCERRGGRGADPGTWLWSVYFCSISMVRILYLQWLVLLLRPRELPDTRLPVSRCFRTILEDLKHLDICLYFLLH